MKTTSLLFATLLALSLSACSTSPLPPTDQQVETTPEPIVQEEQAPTASEESDDILELRMENAIGELDLVE